ncbi:hypothetical protein [Klebsiella michiganensis]|uniref:Uncharacterized protein n=1 Tax=Klebsiella michiganensis TaxID=1134687 RepID=A0A2J4YGY8_9ENTR|nr:hypothetical protein [Klebsiella michiganensis]MBQ4656599.1 hypothetical protein [Klebsiella michiganensis]MBQ4662358.1 hypothetical protein [Klebsiella michiganensis]MBZ7134433.1 hypothetical protein [Klebsiella michiganensis]MBZ7614869.1 hypothetical protein [Klebsiella michiganensis]MDK3152783.1 hypothetical protein [Klebsiella michiganensis]
MDNSIKLILTKFVYSITVHGFMIFWSGIALLFFGCIFQEFSGAASNVFIELAKILVTIAIMMEGGKAIFNKITWGRFS